MVNISEFLISVKETIINLGTVSVAAIVLILILLIILIIIEKRLEKKMVVRGDRNTYYVQAMTQLNSNNPTEELGKIDSLAREFFKEKFGIKKSIGYSELKDSFSKDKNKVAADFCSAMNGYLYSGNNADKETNKKLIAYLDSIIKNNPIPKATFQEKKSVVQKLKEKVSETKSEEI